jgi:hypothetical protein
MVKAGPRGAAAGAKQRRVVLWVLAVIILAAAAVPLLDRWTESRARKAAILDFQYREMTNALVSGAMEQVSTHPMNRLYRERRDGLLKAGYLKKREFPLRNRFESSRAANTFLWRFAAQFPGTEFQLRGLKPPAFPVFVVYARDSDLLAMKWFVMRNDKGAAER